MKDDFLMDSLISFIEREIVMTFSTNLIIDDSSNWSDNV
jgi:hypothetical protein